MMEVQEIPSSPHKHSRTRCLIGVVSAALLLTVWILQFPLNITGKGALRTASNNQNNSTLATASFSPLVLAEDSNDDPTIFETTLIASQVSLEIDGRTVQALAYNGMVPGPLIRVQQGDLVRVHFVNQLDTTATLHWHGVAGNNKADGSIVSQVPVAPGQTYVSEFTASKYVFKIMS